MTVRLAHVWSSDLGIPWSLSYCQPLLARGWEITMICPPGPHVAGARVAGMNVLSHAIPRRIDPLADARGALQLAGHFRRERFDIVHTHNVKVGLMARVVAAAARVPVVVHTMHGLAYSLATPRFPRKVHAMLERLASLRVDAILSQTEEDMRTLIETGVTDPSRLVWVGNGIRIDRFDTTGAGADRASARGEMGIGADEVLFFSAGRFVLRKGFVELFDAFARAHRDNRGIRLAVAGPLDQGTDEAVAPAVIEKARQDGVLLLGERNDMARLYAASDVVVLPSWWEGLSRVLMEAAAMARPLLATDVRGNREVVRPGETGILVPPRDADALAAAMGALAGDRALRGKFGAAAAADARLRFDVRKTVERVNAVYDRLLLSKGLSAR